MAKPFTLPAFVELRDPEEFVPLDDVLLSPALQHRVVDRRQLRRAVDGLRKRGRLLTVPYIGPTRRKP